MIWRGLGTGVLRHFKICERWNTFWMKSNGGAASQVERAGEHRLMEVSKSKLRSHVHYGSSQRKGKESTRAQGTRSDDDDYGMAI
jgi:hypothetical protein